MASESWTLKAEMGGERRRLKDWVRTGEEPTCDRARESAARLFDVPLEKARRLKLEYRDDESDLCTLTDLTLSDALCLAVESRTLSVVVTAASPPEQQKNRPLETLAAHADQLRANVQHGSSRLRTTIQEGGARISLNVQDGGSRLRTGAGQVSTDVFANLQEGGAGIRDGLRNSGEKIRESVSSQYEEAASSFAAATSSETGVSRARVAGAVVVGGVALVATRSFPVSVRLGALAAGSAGVAHAISKPSASAEDGEEGGRGAVENDPASGAEVAEEREGEGEGDILLFAGPAASTSSRTEVDSAFEEADEPRANELTASSPGEVASASADTDEDGFCVIAAECEMASEGVDGTADWTTEA